MNKHVSAIVDKVVAKGMVLVESERVQKILASQGAQKAMDCGLAALEKVQGAAESFKAGVADKLGLATQKELDALREELAGVRAAAEVKTEVEADAAAGSEVDEEQPEAEA